ncbi:putative membrane protein [Rhodococcus wratislaviensis IFP 2016]|nr:putative membrane protein [Rhodococcus wratislaviensis IFP 2016]
MMARLCKAVDIPSEATGRWIVPAAATAGMWFGAVLLAGGDAILTAWLALSLLCVWAAWIDHFTLRFPLTLIRLTTVVGLLFGAFAVAVDQDPAAGGRALLAGVLVFAFNLVFAIVTRGYPGLADVRLSFILGAALGWVGWMNVFSGMLLPNVLALLVMAGVKVIRRQKDLGEFGFAPFLIAGTAVAIAVPPLWWIVWI